MIIKIRMKLKQLFCRHNYKLMHTKEIGVTLNWAMLPDISFKFNYMCKKCRKKKFITGLVYGFLQLNPHRIGNDGWPIDENGERMKPVYD